MDMVLLGSLLAAIVGGLVVHHATRRRELEKVSDAASRRDIEGRADDPAEIAERIQKLRESTTQ